VKINTCEKEIILISFKSKSIDKNNIYPIDKHFEDALKENEMVGEKLA
jgi:hypothetical protein